MKGLTRAANVKFGFSLENLAQNVELDWNEYKNEIEEMLKLAKRWDIDLNRRSKSGKTILQCLCDKANSLTSKDFCDLGNFKTNYSVSRACEELCKFVEKFTALGAKIDIISETNPELNREIRENLWASYKKARVKYRKKDPVVKNVLKNIRTNGWTTKSNTPTQEKSALK